MLENGLSSCETFCQRYFDLFFVCFLQIIKGTVSFELQKSASHCIGLEDIFLTFDLCPIWTASFAAKSFAAIIAKV